MGKKYLTSFIESFCNHATNHVFFVIHPVNDALVTLLKRIELDVTFEKVKECNKLKLEGTFMKRFE